MVKLPPLHSPARILFYALPCLALTLFAFSPRLWLMRTYLPGTFQWDRAHTFGRLPVAHR